MLNMYWVEQKNQVLNHQVVLSIVLDGLVVGEFVTDFLDVEVSVIDMEASVELIIIGVSKVGSGVDFIIIG